MVPVGTSMGALVGNAVGASMGALVGASVGTFMGNAVGASVGVLVDNGVGASEGHLSTSTPGIDNNRKNGECKSICLCLIIIIMAIHGQMIIIMKLHTCWVRVVAAAAR
jgi:hypothetical protein